MIIRRVGTVFRNTAGPGRQTAWVPGHASCLPATELSGRCLTLLPQFSHLEMMLIIVPASQDCFEREMHCFMSSVWGVTGT